MKPLTFIKKEKGMIPSFMLEASGIIPFMITATPLQFLDELVIVEHLW